MASRATVTTAASLVVAGAAIAVTVLALLGRAEAEDRERAADEQAQEAVERSQGGDPAAGLLGAEPLSDREEELRAYFRHDVLSVVNLVQTAVISAACDAAILGQDVSAEAIEESVVSRTERPEIVELPDDEWRALLNPEYVEEELVDCRGGF